MKVNIMSFSSGGGAGHAGSNLARGFSMLGADTVFQTSIETNLKQAPFAAPKLTAAAALDEYVMKSHSWPSLISYFRDKVFSNTSVADADLTVLRWMNGMFGDHLVESLKKSKKVQLMLKLISDNMEQETTYCMSP
jgi:hypothetical protein